VRLIETKAHNIFDLDAVGHTHFANVNLKNTNNVNLKNTNNDWVYE